MGKIRTWCNWTRAMGVGCLVVLMGVDATGADLTYETGQLNFHTEGQSADRNGPTDSLRTDYALIDDFGFGETLVDEPLSLDVVAGTISATLGLGAEARANISFSTTDTGSVTFDYPITVEIDYPEPNCFSQGNVIAIPTRAMLAPGVEAPELRIRTPYMEADHELSATLTAGLIDIEICPLRICGPTFDAQLPFASAGSGGGQFFAVNNASGHFGNVNFPLVDDLEAIGLFPENVPLAYEFDLNVQNLGILGIIGLPVHTRTTDQPIANANGLPTLRTQITSGNTVNTDPFSVDFGYDILSLLKIPLSASLDLEIADFELVAGEIDLVLDITQSTDVQVLPTAMLRIEFEQEMAWLARDPSLPFPDRTELIFSGVQAFVEAGQTLYVAYPDGLNSPMDITPTTRLDTDISNRTSWEFVPEIIFKLFSADFNILGESVLHIPALLDVPVPLARATVNLVGSAGGPDVFPLGGLNSFTTGPITLDPENPIISIEKEASQVLNIGGGEKIVTYTYRLQNQGDVPLYHIQVEDDMSIAFADAVAWEVIEVSSCDLEVNPNYDGATDIEVLADDNSIDGGNSLLEGLVPLPGDVQLGESKVVVVKVLVRAGPSPFGGMEPFPFTNVATGKGVSRVWEPYIPNGTPVDDMAETTINLGPAQIDSLDDFAVYADKIIQLHQSDFSRGNIGSNNMIQVLNGDADTLAGDIHAQGQIAVHGSLVADYVFTRDRLLLTGDLSLPGGYLEEGFDVPAYDLPIVEVTPGSDRVSVRRGGVRNIAPGSYGDVRIGANATIVLSPGIYNVNSFIVGDGALVQFDSVAGYIDLNVAGNLDVGDDAEWVVSPFPATTRDVVVSVSKTGNILIGRDAIVRGTIIAPLSKVTFRRGSFLEGSVHADFVTFELGASFEFHKDTSAVLYLDIDADCDGTYDCFDAEKASVKTSQAGCAASMFAAGGSGTPNTGDLLMLAMAIVALTGLGLRTARNSTN